MLILAFHSKELLSRENKIGSSRKEQKIVLNAQQLFNSSQCWAEMVFLTSKAFKYFNYFSISHGGEAKTLRNYHEKSKVGGKVPHTCGHGMPMECKRIEF